jgi:nitric oxide reductase subunit B
MQTWAAVGEGTWYARSAEFMQTPLMQQLRWIRIVGDTIFAAGVLALIWFKLGLLTGHSYAESAELTDSRTLTPEAETMPVA